MENGAKAQADAAIGVLPEEFTKGADRIARFQFEARLLILLNHPNISAIYGLADAMGTYFRILERVKAIFLFMAV